MALKLTLKAASTRSAVTPGTGGAAGNLAIQAATEYRAAALDFDTAKANLATKREGLMIIVEPEREKSLRNGTADTSLDIPTTDGNRVKVVFQERFRGIDPSNKAALLTAFGSEYSGLVGETQTVTFRRGTDLSAIENALGKGAMKKLLALLVVKEAVSPKKGAYENVAKLFAKGETDMAEDLLMFANACASSPQVRAK